MSIAVKNLSFQYETGTPFATDALQDINFTIQKGEFVGIMGHYFSLYAVFLILQTELFL